MAWSKRQQVKWIQHLKAEGCDRKDHRMHDYYVSELRSLRKMLNKSEEKDYVFIKGDWDWAVIRFPIGQWSDLETAKEYAENFKLYCHSPYDCSGELFTAWQEVHYWQGQYWCWQSNHLNV